MEEKDLPRYCVKGPGCVDDVPGAQRAPQQQGCLQGGCLGPLMLLLCPDDGDGDAAVGMQLMKA